MDEVEATIASDASEVFRQGEVHRSRFFYRRLDRSGDLPPECVARIVDKGGWLHDCRPSLLNGNAGSTPRYVSNIAAARSFLPHDVPRYRHMIGWMVLLALPLAVYCTVQTLRDLKRRTWPMFAWGCVMSAGLLWLIWALLMVRSY